MRTMRRLLQEQRGSVLIYVTLSMVVLLAFGAGVADMGNLYENRRQLQNGTDGAALAGAHELLQFDLSVAQRTALAVNTALDYAQRNGISASQVQSGYPEVTCVPLPYNNNCDTSSEYYYNAVKMTADRDLNLLVGALFNNGVGNVEATATAIVSPVLPTEGLWPWGVSNCGDWNWDGKTECGVPEDVPIVLKFASPPGSAGNFFPLDFPNSSGSNAYKDYIQYGYGYQSGQYIKPTLPWCGAVQAPGCTTQDNPYVETETGNQVGPTKTGVDYLVSMAASSGQDDPNSSWNQPDLQCTWPNAPTDPTKIPLPDPIPPLLAPYVPPGWTGGGSPPPANWVGNASSCYRVGIVPIIYQQWNQLSGHSPVDIIGYGGFYLIGRTTGPGGKMIVWGYFTSMAKVGGGRFSDTDTGLWEARLWD